METLVADLTEAFTARELGEALDNLHEMALLYAEGEGEPIKAKDALRIHGLRRFLNGLERMEAKA
jgi:hypothetical protein